MSTLETELQPYIRDGFVEPVDDERCRATLGSWSWTGLAAAIAGFDAEIESAEPRELVEAFATLAARFAAVAP